MNLLEYLKEKNTPSQDPELNKNIQALYARTPEEEKKDEELKATLDILKKAEKKKDLLKIPFYIYKKIVKKERKKEIEGLINPIETGDVFVAYSKFIEHEQEVMKDISPEDEYTIYFDKILYYLYNQNTRIHERSRVTDELASKKLSMREQIVVRRYSLRSGKLNVEKTQTSSDTAK